MAWVQIVAVTLSGNSLRQTVHTHSSPEIESQGHRSMTMHVMVPVSKDGNAVGLTLILYRGTLFSS